MPKEETGGGAEMAALQRKIESQGVSPRKAIAMGGDTPKASPDKQTRPGRKS